MTRRMICIECPKGCALSVGVENCRVVRVSGNECPKGEKYAVSEAENPLRVLTSSVFCENLDLKMAPVRTDRAIPKSKLTEAMAEVKRIKVDKPLKAGDIIVKNFMGLDADLIVTRRVDKHS